MNVDLFLRLLFSSTCVFQISSFPLDSLHSPIDCLGHQCHIECQISRDKHGQFSGSCHIGHYDLCIDRSFTLQYGEMCRCQSQECIQNVLSNSKSAFIGHFSCGNHTCDHGQSCHLYISEDQIKTTCNNHKPLTNERCHTHDSINQPHGCYCETAECVGRTAMHCFGTTCSVTQGCKVSNMSFTGQLTADCIKMPYKCDSDICMAHCSSAHNLPCYCDTQHCADSFAVHVASATIMAPTTTTGASADSHHACVGLQCDQFKPICNLFENSKQISGRCVDQMVGPQCGLRQDITSNQGCSCKDTTCVLNALLTYQQHSTDPTPSLELTTAPGILCDIVQCTFEPYCYLFEHQGVATGKCMLINPWPVCSSHEQISNNGCYCTTTDCVTKALTDFSKMHITQSPVTSTQSLSSTSLVEQATTQPPNAQQIAIESTTVKKTSASNSSTTIANKRTQTTSTAATSTTALPTTAPTPTTTITTVNTEMTTSFVLTWTCLDQECPYPQYCRLKLGSNRLYATCEQNKNGTRCANHTSIFKEGCWCDTPLCVTRIALHCFGTNCPADQQCKVTKTMDGNYTGTCSPLGTQNSSLCDRKLQQSECNCWTQSCIDFFKTKTAPLPTTESTSTSATTESSTTANTTQSPTTVTTTATTTKPTSTLASTTLGSPRVCNTCGLQAIQIPCSTREINMDLPTTCPVGQDYCMTDIIQDASGNVEVYKRCVDLATCKREWISETADQDYCKQYGVITNPAAFSCHFCCVNDSCNSHMLPNSTTLYTKSNK